MERQIQTSDLIDAQEVAKLCGLSHPNSVPTYQRRYLEMPRPVVDLGPRRVKLWSRKEVRAWANGEDRLNDGSSDAQTPEPLTDRPIESFDEDLLDRGSLAAALAGAIASVDANRGVVIGVLGPWGVGKTSLINLACERLDPAESTIIEFNPWLFSGTEQLLERFFAEFAAQLKLGGSKKLLKIGSKLERYGAFVAPSKYLPVVGPVAEAMSVLASGTGKVIKKRDEELSSVTSLKADLEKELQGSGKRFVVVVDDIDRLAPSEVRDIFKLVRLTASFPNVIYLLAFDRIRTQDALTEEHFDGAAYLEKILQISYDVPSPPHSAMHEILSEGLGEVLRYTGTAPQNFESLADVYAECIWPFIRNARDIRRYLASLPVALKLLGNEIWVGDVLALEALRVFEPKTHVLLPGAIGALTTPDSTSRYGQQRAVDHKTTIDRFIASAGDRAAIIGSICRHLFPASQSHLGGPYFASDYASTWKREQRVAHASILQFYVDRAMSAEVSAARTAREAFDMLPDAEAFAAILDDLNPDDLEALLTELAAYEDRFTADMALPVTRAVLDVMPRLRVEGRGMFDYGADLEAQRLVLRVLRGQPKETIEEVVNAALGETHPLSSLFSIVTIVGHRENAGHRLVAKDVAANFETRLRGLLDDAAPSRLVDERNLDGLIWWFGFGDGGTGRPPTAFEDAGVREAFLRAAKSETRSQVMGSRAVHREPGLHWTLLLDVFGGEDALRDAIEEIDSDSAEPEMSEVLQLVKKYLSGWRPRDMGGDE